MPKWLEALRRDKDTRETIALIVTITVVLGGAGWAVFTHFHPTPSGAPPQPTASASAFGKTITASATAGTAPPPPPTPASAVGKTNAAPATAGSAPPPPPTVINSVSAPGGMAFGGPVSGGTFVVNNGTGDGKP